MKHTYQFIATHASSYSVTLLCRVLGLARSGYYAWKRRPASTHAQQDVRLTTQIQAIFRDSRATYGSPRVHATLLAQGQPCSRKRVARLMRTAALVSRRRQRRIRTTDSCHQQPVASNVLARNFQPRGPNQVWLADMTYLPTREGWLYLAVVLDLFARRVVGWSMAPMRERTLVVNALQHALDGRHPTTALIHHSDRGSQYASSDYQAMLATAHITPSMSRKGNCWDNAPMESFFASLKAEVDIPIFESHTAARSMIFDYIERFYNRQRRHSTLAYTTPVAYEQRWQEQQITV